MKIKALTMIAAVAVLGGLSVAASAQRDPAYAAARAGGEVGEQPDGYLGLVGAASGATVEQLAFTSGCNLIAGTNPGEKYKTPGGVWKTRTAAAPERDSRCV